MVPDKRQQIMLVASQLFSTQGYHKTTVADIARDADVAQGTVYLYFDSKKAIFSALVDQTLELFKEIQLYSTRRRCNTTIDEIEEGLTDAYRHVLRLFKNEPTLVRLMLTEVRGADPEIEAKLGHFYEQVVEEIAVYLQIGINAGWVRPDLDPPLVAQCLIGMMERIAALMLQEERGDLDKMATELARFQLNGIAIAEPVASVKQQRIDSLGE